MKPCSPEPLRPRSAAQSKMKPPRKKSASQSPVRQKPPPQTTPQKNPAWNNSTEAFPPPPVLRTWKDRVGAAGFHMVTRHSSVATSAVGGIRVGAGLRGRAL